MDSRQRSNILTADDYNKLVAAERELHDMLADLDAQESCGFDCQAFREIRQHQLDQISRIKQAYFPTPPLPGDGNG